MYVVHCCGKVKYYLNKKKRLFCASPSGAAVVTRSFRGEGGTAAVAGLIPHLPAFSDVSSIEISPRFPNADLTPIITIYNEG